MLKQSPFNLSFAILDFCNFDKSFENSIIIGIFLYHFAIIVFGLNDLAYFIVDKQCERICSEKKSNSYTILT